MINWTSSSTRQHNTGTLIYRRELYSLHIFTGLQFLKSFHSCRFWATVCKTVRPLSPMLSDRCRSVLSVLCVILVYCGQTVARIKMKLGKQVGLGSGHIVLEGDPGPLPQRGISPAIFGPYQLCPNGSMDQDATW